MPIEAWTPRMPGFTESVILISVDKSTEINLKLARMRRGQSAPPTISTAAHVGMCNGPVTRRANGP